MDSFSDLKNALEEIEPLPKRQVNPLVFTRYLYPKEQVKHSLLIALLEKQVDEALFWTYELYHSGFELELYEYIYSVYEMFYKLSNSPALGKCLEDIYDKWSNDQALHHMFGSMIKNLICRPYNVNLFLETYVGVKCEQFVPLVKEGKFLRMNFSAEDAKTYETVVQKSRFVLPKVYKYAIRHNTAALFQCSNLDIKEQYRMHWAYYCWDCPYWRAIMEDKYFGRVNHEECIVDFYDDAQDHFYDHYGYEPDEQLTEVQQKSIGTGQEVQMTIKDFADRYGGTMIKKTIRLSILQSHK